MLREISQNLWVDEVSFKMLGIDFGNRMTCIKLSDNSLLLHSPNKFARQTCDKLLTLGEIRYLLTPSLMHNLFVMEWKERISGAQVFAPRAAKKLSYDIVLDEHSGEDFSRRFNGEISCVPIKGMPLLQEYAFIHHSSQTLILTDLAFNFRKVDRPWAKTFLMLYGAYNKFAPSITIRTLIRNKHVFAECIEKICAEQFERIIISHGDIVEANGKEVFQRAFRKYLLTSSSVSKT